MFFVGVGVERHPERDEVFDMSRRGAVDVTDLRERQN